MAAVGGGGGGTCSAIAGVVSGTCAATVFGTPGTLPNGTVTTTQASGDGSLDLSTDAFVANALQAINPATNVQVSTTTVLPNSPAYVNTGGGVGATLTATTNGAFAAVDGYSASVGDRLLIQNQASTLQDGVYTVTSLGSGGSHWQLTRAADYNTITNINYTGFICTVQTGSTYAGDTCFLLANLISAVGTSAITYNQQSAGASAGKPGGGVQFTGNVTAGDAIKVAPGASGKNIVDAGVAFSSLTQTVGSGTIALTTSSISSASCSSASTVTITGTATTDTVIATLNADPTGVTGYLPSTSGSLYIWVYPTLNTVNAKVCNNTTTTQTPSALTLNVKVVR
jgi:hypothetical protein